jgi:hypothetical protein
MPDETQDADPDDAEERRRTPKNAAMSVSALSAPSPKSPIIPPTIATTPANRSQPLISLGLARALRDAASRSWSAV